MAEPGYKVTIQQDFLVYDSERQLIPKSRHKSIEMYKPRVWEDVTRYEEEEVGGGVVCLKVEVAPADREAREDFNKFIREMIEQKSNNGEILFLYRQMKQFFHFFRVLRQETVDWSDDRSQTTSSSSLPGGQSAKVYL